MKILYKNLTAIILSAGCAMFSFAQPAWNVDPYAFEFSMTITAKITTDGVLSEDINDRVAAFVDDNCRGVSNVTFERSVDGYYLYLMVYSNKPAETVMFKIYDAGNNEIFNAKSSLIFVINDIVGSLDSPFIISSEKLNDKAEITNFTIPGQIGETLFSGRNLYLQRSPNSALTGIIASFSISEGAKVFVNGLIQESGKSINDFIEPVLYTVISADFTDTVEYKVFITDDLTVMNHVEIEKSDFVMYPNPFNEFILIEIPQNMSEVIANIYSANGKIVMSQKLLPGIKNKLITHSFIPGVYFVELTNGVNYHSQKIVKY